jgi:hypothetical protein
MTRQFFLMSATVRSRRSTCAFEMGKIPLSRNAASLGSWRSK